MPRKGRLLEVLVKALEKLLAPHGIVVQSPEIIYQDVEGKRKKIGEIDITLRGNFGSAELFVGFECRDRPKQGTEWITQVAGKKQLLKLDAVTAVSDTGFTPEAVAAARDLKVQLMVLKDASIEDLKEWIIPEKFEFSLVDYYLLPNICMVATKPIHEDLKLESDIGKIYVTYPRTNKKLTLQEYIEPTLKSELLTSNWNEDTNEQNRTLIFNEQIQIFANRHKFSISKMSIPILMYREKVTSEVIMQSYSKPDEDSPRAMVGIATLNLRKGEIKAIISQKRAPNSQVIEQNIEFVGMDGETMNFMSICGTVRNVSTGEKFPLVF